MTTTHKVKGEVTFECEGKNYRFKLGTNAQVIIEKKAGMPLSKFLKADRLDEIGAEGIRMIFWAGLTRQHPELTEDEVGDILDELGADRIKDIFEEAFEAAMVKNAGGVREDPPAPAKGQTGTNS